MLRFSLFRRIGVEGDIIFRSISKDKSFINSRVAQVGSAQTVLKPAASSASPNSINQAGEEEEGDRNNNNNSEAIKKTSSVEDNKNNNSETATTKEENDTFSRRMTQEELNRFTTSLSSKDNLHNWKVGAVPSNVVDEKTGLPEGANYPDPCRYGDWEYNGRCTDF